MASTVKIQVAGQVDETVCLGHRFPARRCVPAAVRAGDNPRVGATGDLAPVQRIGIEHHDLSDAGPAREQRTEGMGPGTAGVWAARRRER
jgi:hypothetical protein